MQLVRKEKLRALKKLADECTKVEGQKAAAAEKAEEALAAYVTVALRATEAQNGLRERFAAEAGHSRDELLAGLDANGTDTAAISGNTPARQTPFAHALHAAVGPLAMGDTARSRKLSERREKRGSRRGVRSGRKRLRTLDMLRQMRSSGEQRDALSGRKRRTLSEPHFCRRRASV